MVGGVAAGITVPTASHAGPPLLLFGQNLQIGIRLNLIYARTRTSIGIDRIKATAGGVCIMQRFCRKM